MHLPEKYFEMLKTFIETKALRFRKGNREQCNVVFILPFGITSYDEGPWKNEKHPILESIAHKAKCFDLLHQIQTIRKLIKMHLELSFHPLNFSSMFAVKESQYVFPSCKDGRAHGS